MTPRPTRHATRRLRGGWLVGALLFSLVASCGKTDPAGGNGETHFLSSCTESCGEGLACLCGVCTIACESESACTVPGSTCLDSPLSCTEAERTCDAECTDDAGCTALGSGYRCVDGRCRAGEPKPDPEPEPPEDDFAHCALAPATTCSREAFCELVNCGGIQFDEQGCARTPCENDADCASDEICLPLSSSHTGRCEPAADGTCDCSGGLAVVSGAFCSPRDNPPPLDRMCDGSSELRFAAVVSGGGMVPGYDQFLKPYAWKFLLVDGTCRYYVSTDVSGEIRTGTLSATEELELSSAAGWGSLAAWDGHIDDSECLDGAGERLFGPGASAGCTCGCDSDAPEGLEAALTAVTVLEAEYGASGAPLETPLRVVAAPPDWPSQKPIFDWPLEWPIADIAEDSLYTLTAESGITLEDTEDVAALRALRDEAEAAGETSGILFVRDDDDTVHALLVRDLLPEALRLELEQRISPSE